MSAGPLALIADDEALLAQTLAAELAALWPELRLLPLAHDGLSAIAAIEENRPDIAFLDIFMPGASGIEVAAHLAELPEEDRPLLVFTTAYDEYAVEAFEQAAVDYLLKPVRRDRLAASVERLRRRLESIGEARAEGSGAAGGEAGGEASGETGSEGRGHRAGAASTIDPALLEDLARHLGLQPRPAGRMKFVRASMGQELRLIPVEEVCYFEAANKYVLVVTTGAEALIRTPIKELIEQLDAEKFWQVHRGTLVNIDHVAGSVSGPLGRLQLWLRQREELLPVSRQYAHLFRPL
ncbi:MAG: LytTR family DNA-binding domain-containing protein [Candidatus Protistobacter heckmanni]|nr:LytTR family DNA-binding domain-containing protein [Candidatus Protistobacter heckmanni]